MALPEYLIEPLIEHMPAVEADRIFWLCKAATIPHLRQHDREEFFDMLRVMRADLYPMVAAPAPMLKEGPRDGEAAADYFRSMGVKVA